MTSTLFWTGGSVGFCPKREGFSHAPLIDYSDLLRHHSVEQESGDIIIVICKEFEITPVFPYKKLIVACK